MQPPAFGTRHNCAVNNIHPQQSGPTATALVPSATAAAPILAYQPLSHPLPRLPAITGADHETCEGGSHGTHTDNHSLQIAPVPLPQSAAHVFIPVEHPPAPSVAGVSHLEGDMGHQLALKYDSQQQLQQQQSVSAGSGTHDDKQKPKCRHLVQAAPLEGSAEQRPLLESQTGNTPHIVSPALNMSSGEIDVCITLLNSNPLKFEPPSVVHMYMDLIPGTPGPHCLAFSLLVCVSGSIF